EPERAIAPGAARAWPLRPEPRLRAVHRAGARIDGLPRPRPAFARGKAARRARSARWMTGGQTTDDRGRRTDKRKRRRFYPSSATRRVRPRATAAPRRPGFPPRPRAYRRAP